MPKITEERMREIYLAGMRLLRSGTFKTIEDAADKFINHPEIKSLFEDDEHVRVNEILAKVEIASEAHYKTVENFNNQNSRIGFNYKFGCAIDNLKYLISPEIYNERLPGSGKTIESSCKEIVDDSIEGYEVLNTGLTCPHGVKCMYLPRETTEVGTVTCNNRCETNGKQNFKGHESHSSIRCAFEVNNGG